MDAFLNSLGIFGNILFILMLCSGFPIGLAFARLSLSRGSNLQVAAGMGSFITIATPLILPLLRWPHGQLNGAGGVVAFLIILAIPAFHLIKIVMAAILADAQYKKDPDAFSKKESARPWVNPMLGLIYPLQDIFLAKTAVEIGRKIDPEKKIGPSSVPNVGEEKPMPWYLLLGITLLPFIFAWFTLQKGYGTRTRLWSFGWMIAFCTMQILYIISYR